MLIVGRFLAPAEPSRNKHPIRRHRTTVPLRRDGGGREKSRLHPRKGGEPGFLRGVEGAAPYEWGRYCGVGVGALDDPEG